jgi:hypothetical protein
MKYQYPDIMVFFEQNGYIMHGPRPGYDYIESGVRDGLGFVLYAKETEVAFCWQVKKGQPLLDDKLPEIQKIRPAARAVPGENDEWIRLFIPLDQSKPLVDALDVVKQSGNLLGY